MMPEMGGREATKKIKEFLDIQGRRKPPPILALTANAFAEDSRRCIEAGMDAYVSES